ncbi:MAG: hypothetical protein ABI426_12250, partial [Flavobacterium sp.]
ILLVTSCSVEPTEQNLERNSSQNLNPNFTEPTFMSGDLNGLPYNNLKPLDYFDSASLQTKVETFQTTPLISYNYLLLQGSDVTYNEQPLATSILINIRIPESQWAVGTYNLKDDEITGIDGINSCASLVEVGSVTKTKAISGTLTITEFDVTTRIIKGTFSFSYLRRNGEDSVGPYQLTNGAFKYKLDAPYFD